MPTWLDMVSMEIKNMDPDKLIEPGGEVTSKDHVVGEMDDDHKRFYSLAMQWEKAALEIALAGHYGNVNERAQAMRKAYQLRKKAEVLLENFWLSLNDTFDLWDKPSSGVRRGWKVVWSEPSAPSIFDILENM